MTGRLDQPPTLEEYREWEKTASRPWTQDPIGTDSAGQRSIDARHSKLVEPVPVDPPQRRRPAKGEAA